MNQHGLNPKYNHSAAIEEKEVWYFTFMFSQQDLSRKYVRIEGTFEDTRAKMIGMFGKKWAFQYSAKEFSGQPTKYGLKELK